MARDIPQEPPKAEKPPADQKAAREARADSVTEKPDTTPIITDYASL